MPRLVNSLSVVCHFPSKQRTRTILCASLLAEKLGCRAVSTWPLWRYSTSTKTKVLNIKFDFLEKTRVLFEIIK